MLKTKEPNPLAIFNMRRLDFCPPHFQRITFDLYVNDKDVLDWIYEYTNGRFYFGQITEDKRTSYCAAFEHHSECSYFSLMLSTFNNSNLMSF